MQIHGNNQGLIRFTQAIPVRKAFDYFHKQSILIKTSLALLTGTLLVGSAVMWSSATTPTNSSVGPELNKTPVSTEPLTPPTPQGTGSISAPRDNGTISVGSSSAQSGSTAASVSSSSTSVSVNGQNITIPASGSVHQTVSNGDGGNTTVDVNLQNSGSQGSTSYVNVQSSSTSSGSSSTFVSQSGSGQ